MQFGIDFGTTRTVVAVADRGNYPVVSFLTEAGDFQQWYPVLIAARGEECVFAFDALAHQHESRWMFLRSLKRHLAESGPDSVICLGENEMRTLEALTRYLTNLSRDLRERSNLEISSLEPFEALIAVPANANSNQRFLTLEAFKRAGFRVLGMVNEPSAAGIEYSQRYSPKDGSGRKDYLVVYDLGGGTFDASVIGMKERQHEVITDEGISKLGGNDFDEILLDLALSNAGDIGELSDTARYLLLEECRRHKESLHPNTRKIVVDLSRAADGAGEVIIRTDDYYERCAPLVERTIGAVEKAMVRARAADVDWRDVAAVYVVGGSSDLPIVGRTLRERYGRRVRRSPYPFAATAIGLAIAADTGAGYALRERFTRYFGLWREADRGQRIIFDPIFCKDTPLPRPSDAPLVHTRLYNPAHNIGHFRYLECSEVSADAQPGGDITPWDEILFPLDPALREVPNLQDVEVRRMEGMGIYRIEERYVCGAHAMIEVEIANRTAGYQRKYCLRELPDEPRRKRRPPAKTANRRGTEDTK